MNFWYSKYFMLLWYSKYFMVGSKNLVVGYSLTWKSILVEEIQNGKYELGCGKIDFKRQFNSCISSLWPKLESEHWPTRCWSWKKPPFGWFLTWKSILVEVVQNGKYQLGGGKIDFKILIGQLLYFIVMTKTQIWALTDKG